MKTTSNTHRGFAAVMAGLLLMVVLLPVARADDQDATAAAVDERAVSIVSEGVLIRGTLYYRKSSSAEPLPTIVMSTAGAVPQRCCVIRPSNLPRRDPRVRALASQVGYMGQPISSASATALAKSYEDATRRTHGEVGYPAPRAREVGNLQGAPVREKFLLYAPIEDVARTRNCAMLFIAAEHEELFDNKQHPQLAYERAAEPRKYVVIPGITHYGIYGEARERATRLAIDWFDEHLKKQ